MLGAYLRALWRRFARTSVTGSEGSTVFARDLVTAEIDLAQSESNGRGRQEYSFLLSTWVCVSHREAALSLRRTAEPT